MYYILLLPKWEGGAEKYIQGECEPVCSQLTEPRAMNEQILVDVFAGFSRTRTELTEGFLPLTFYKKQHAAATINGAINRLILSDMLIESEDETEYRLILDIGKLPVGSTPVYEDVYETDEDGYMNYYQELVATKTGYLSGSAIIVFGCKQ